MIWPRNTFAFVSHRGFEESAPGDANRLMGEGRLIHRTATLALTEATLFDAQGKNLRLSKRNL